MNSPTNPYIAGNPITGTEMFFGRQDVFRFVRETLVGRYQDNAIVLYGGRRTGKTTVLYQMGRHLAPRYVPVFVDLQGISLQGLGEMLWGIARQIARTLRRQKGIRLNIPPRDEFASDPGGCFCDNFLDPVLEALGDDHLLLMLDEAARLYEQVQAGRLEPRVFDLLRSLIKYHPHLNFVFSIGSGLEEMRREYTVLFNVCQYRKISFLDRDAGIALITEPVKEHYRYAPGAAERILEVTHGHPYYTQLVCNRLFARWARQGSDEVTLSDVEAVLSEAAEQGMASLQYTWEEASDGAKVVLAALAELVSDANQQVSPDDLRATFATQEIALSRRAVNGALRELVTREVLRPTNGGYVFTVDLMRLWLQQYQRLEWVKSTIPPPEEARPPVRRDWVRMVLVGVSAGLLLLLIGLSVTVWRSTKQAKLETQATATAMSGTISALETAIARGAGSDAEAQLAVMQTKSAEMQATQQIPTNTPAPTDIPSPLTTPTPAGPILGDTWTRPADGMVMVYVPAGEFEMGSMEGDSDEQPVHTVVLDGFWIDHTEVTNAQFTAFLNEQGNQWELDLTWLELEDEDCLIEQEGGEYRPKSGYADHPVVEISWCGAVAYCEWAGSRLPTEAEWEYAARGPDGHIYPWGNDAPTCELAQFNKCSWSTVLGGSLPAGASWCDALDMAGNVWEWVTDWYGSYPSRQQVNPMGPSSGEYRVLRGGSWFSEPYAVRGAVRRMRSPSDSSSEGGFRCTRDSE